MTSQEGPFLGTSRRSNATGIYQVRGTGDSPRHLTSLLQYHVNMSLSIPLRFTRGFRHAHMRPTVPSINFKPFLYGSAGDRQLIASEIDEALRSVGFIQLRNHGIEQHKVDACFQWVS